MRLAAHLHTDEGRVRSIQLRIAVHDLPAGASVRVTDVQLQAGRASGVVPNPREAGTWPGERQWRNGVVNGEMDTIVLANVDAPAPTRLRIVGRGTARVGAFRFGDLAGSATATHETATQGWGRVPVITPRADLPIRAATTGRTHLTIDWQERA